MGAHNPWCIPAAALSSLPFPGLGNTIAVQSDKPYTVGQAAPGLKVESTLGFNFFEREEYSAFKPSAVGFKSTLNLRRVHP